MWCSASASVEPACLFIVPVAVCDSKLGVSDVGQDYTSYDTSAGQNLLNQGLSGGGEERGFRALMETLSVCLCLLVIHSFSITLSFLLTVSLSISLSIYISLSHTHTLSSLNSVNSPQTVDPTLGETQDSIRDVKRAGLRCWQCLWCCWGTSIEHSDTLLLDLSAGWTLATILDPSL